MQKVRFYEEMQDDLLKFAVIVAKCNGKWVFCKHKERQTYECPGGHREAQEGILETAKRELYEETGAIEYSIHPACVYSVQDHEEETGAAGEEVFGMLYYADIAEVEELPQESEMEKIELFTDLPSNWTYPEIQPKLVEKAELIAG